MTTRKRYAIVGTGGRSMLYIDALLGAHGDTGDLVGLCDTSRMRLEWHNRRIGRTHGHAAVATYTASDFDRMVNEQRPDVVIVTSIDSTHDGYVIRAMERGCDVICEKPMTTDAAKANAILSAVARTGRKLRITFNLRYAPFATKVRELLATGAIGTPTSVDLSWVLDTSHGADYFRRWHAELEKSGGLLVHKATHHFDLVNWWIDSYPQRVFAMADLKFYGHENARGRGQTFAYERYTGAPEAAGDPFGLTLDQDHDLRGLYYDAEAESGYVRDRNVFGDHVTIGDTHAVMVRYRNGVVLNYSLVAYAPWEGFRLSITGTKGRLELYDKHGAHVIASAGVEGDAVARARQNEQLLCVFPMFGVPFEVPVPTAPGTHGGSDPQMLADLFLNGAAVTDPLARAASHIDGTTSLLVGLCANQSIASGLPIECDDLILIDRGR